MKIIDAKLQVVEVPLPHPFPSTWNPGNPETKLFVTIAEIITDDGIHGYGAACDSSQLLAGIWDTHIRPLVIGKEITQVEAINTGLVNASLYAYRPWCVEVAVWDALGKYANLPIYKMLGGVQDKVLAYAVLGGIPHYLNQFSPDLSIEENIKQNILTRGSVLYSEVEFLLHQELRETPMYNSVIEAIATGSTKLNEISQRAMVDDTAKTSVYLRNLIELGIVQREFSVDAKSKERTNTGRGIYRLTDNFFRFWYAYGFSNLSQLEDGDVDGVYDYMVRPDLNRFAALPFEDICQEFVRELQKRNALPFRYSKMGRWLGRTTVRDQNTESGLRQAETEIDLLAISQDAQEYLVGECKFKHSPFSYSEYLDTTSKLSSWKKDSVFYYALFSASGFDQKIVDIARDTETLKLYNLENIVHQISPV